MQEEKKLSLEQIEEFLEASQEWQFAAKEREEIYEWLTGVLKQHQYGQQGRGAKGLLRPVSGEDDRDEPSTDHATHCALWRGGSGKSARVPATSFCEQVHARRYRVAGKCG